MRIIFICTFDKSVFSYETKVFNSALFYFIARIAEILFKAKDVKFIPGKDGLVKFFL